MKNASFSSAFFLPVLLILLLTTNACNKDNINRDDFLGTYSCHEQQTTPSGVQFTNDYTMTIVAGASSDEIVLQDLNDGEVTISAIVNGSDLEFIQTGDPDKYPTGRGSLNGKILTLTYQVPEYYYSGGSYGTHTIAATCTKK